LTSIDSDGYSTDTLRNELTALGHSPGPITLSTKKVYIRRLFRLKKERSILPQEVKTDRESKLFNQYFVELVLKLNVQIDLKF